MAEPVFAMIVPMGGGPVAGNELPSPPVYPSHGLPGAPAIPGNALPSPPPGVWPPLTPSVPIQPAPPTTPPGSIWPPPNRPDAGLPVPPATVGGGPIVPSEKFWVVAGIPGVGWRYICVDPSLDAGMPLPPVPEPK